MPIMMSIAILHKKPYALVNPMIFKCNNDVIINADTAKLIIQGIDEQYKILEQDFFDKHNL